MTTAVLALAAVVAAPASASCGSTGVFSDSGGVAKCKYLNVGSDAFTVPPYRTTMTFDVFGAGGTYLCTADGGEAKGDLTVVPFDQFQINVGGPPTTGGPDAAACEIGGWNGGGNGGDDHTDTVYYGRGGAGASDVRTGAHGLSDRLFVGGGGGGLFINPLNGSANPLQYGSGGGLAGADGGDGIGSSINTSGGGKGGTQTAGGASSGGVNDASSAGFGFGGSGGAGLFNFYAGGAGGGGGWYGGGGSGSAFTGPGNGGGGSGHVTSAATNVFLDQGGIHLTDGHETRAPDNQDVNVNGNIVRPATYGNGEVIVSWDSTPVTATVTLTSDKPNPVPASDFVNLTAHVTTSTGATAVGFVILIDSNGSSRRNLGSGYLEGNGDYTLRIRGSSLPFASNGIVALYEDIYSVIDNTYSSSLDVERERLNQTINFTSTPPSNPTTDGPSYLVSASASSGLPVSLSIPSSSSSVCSITGSTVSFLAQGTCVIYADQAGNDTYAPATRAMQELTVDWGLNKIPITATVFGAQTQGGTPHFFYASNSPPGVTLLGTVSCDTVLPGTPIDGLLSVGSYTIDGSSCSGLTPSDGDHYSVTYVGRLSGFRVSLPAIIVTPSGSQTFGGTPTFTYTSNAPDGVTISGSVTCTQVGVGDLIRPDMGPGTYSLTVARCSGLTASGGYQISYASGPFVVNPAVIHVTVSGDQGYAGGPEFFFTQDSPFGFGALATVTCTKLDDGTTIANSLPVGAYTIDASTCSGLVAPFGYTLEYETDIGGFHVNPIEIVVTVFGGQTYGGAPDFEHFDNAQHESNLLALVGLGPIELSGTLTCTSVAYRTPITPTLPLGDYSVEGRSCSGLSLSDPHNFRLTYAGEANGGFRVSPGTITVNVSGSEVQGGTPDFTYTDDAPDGVTLSGDLTCTQVKGTGVGIPSLTPGTYTLDGRFDYCSGLSASDPTNYNIVYIGVTDGLVVTPSTVHVQVSGTQTYGGSPHFTETDDAPSGVTLSGSLGCDTVDSGTNIAPTLAPGGYSVDGSSCHGLTASDGRDVSYSGVTDGFTVSPATIHVHASGTQTFGGSPHFTQTNDAPAGVTLSGSLGCDTVDSGTAIAPTLTPGSYTIDGSSCDGLSPSDATDYTVSYSGVVDGFVVSKRTVTVNVSGTQTFGGSPHFTQTNDAPGGAGLSGTPSCSTVGASTTITTSLAGGSYTVLGSSCSGMTLGDTTDYGITYAGVTNGFVVGAASTSILYNGQQLVLIGNSLVPAAALSSPTALCTGSKTVSFSLDANPTTGAATPYTLESAVTNASGQAVGAAISTTGWQEGQYTITARFAGTGSCAASSYDASFSVASPGDAASGGGWYNASGSGRSNFGFTVRKVPNTTNTYSGQLLLINNGKWRIKGTLTSYGTSGTSALTGTKAGSASGTGALYWWNQTLNSGLGGWQLSRSPVAFTINFSASGAGKKASAGSFGIQISYKPVAPEPSTLPNSTPQLLKGGTVNVS